MVVRFEDETGKAHEILDRDMENQQYYKRGTVGDIYADLDRRPYSASRCSSLASSRRYLSDRNQLTTM